MSWLAVSCLLILIFAEKLLKKDLIPDGAALPDMHTELSLCMMLQNNSVEESEEYLSLWDLSVAEAEK